MKLHHFSLLVLANVERRFLPQFGKANARPITGAKYPGVDATRNCLNDGQLSFYFSTAVMLLRARSDKTNVRLIAPTREAARTISIPWALQMKAVSVEEPSRLVQVLTGAILGCGGWVLSRGASDTGTVSMLFEFERQACVDIYSVMIAAGLELSQNGHIRFTELCQCTRSHPQDCGTEIASVDLEVQTYPAELTRGAGIRGID
jgi:hypothetical protein